MSEAFLKDPLALFSVKGKVAVITGASGAFGALAAKVLAGAGAKLVLTAGKKAELDAVSDECRKLGAEVEGVNVRPSSEEACASIVEPDRPICANCDRIPAMPASFCDACNARAPGGNGPPMPAAVCTMTDTPTTSPSRCSPSASGSA